jgi:hypothetical protein
MVSAAAPVTVFVAALPLVPPPAPLPLVPLDGLLVPGVLASFKAGSPGTPTFGPRNRNGIIRSWPRGMLVARRGWLVNPREVSPVMNELKDIQLPGSMMRAMARPLAAATR